MKKFEHVFEAAKYGNKWAVFDTESRTFSFIGCGKKYCQKRAYELNKYLYYEEI